MAWDEMQEWGLQIQQLISHESHTEYELSDDNTIIINSEPVGDVVMMTTDTYGEIVAGKVIERINKIQENYQPVSKPFWTRSMDRSCFSSRHE